MSLKKVRIMTTDADIDAAIAAANLYEPFRPKAISVAYRKAGDVFLLKMSSGIELLIPRRLLQGLETATIAQLSEVKIGDAQSALHWESIDVGHYIPSLLEGVFGNRRWMSELGKIGGSSRSDAKRAASRANGAKGGRPKAATAAHAKAPTPKVRKKA